VRKRAKLEADCLHNIYMMGGEVVSITTDAFSTDIKKNDFVKPAMLCCLSTAAKQHKNNKRYGI
jgi:hypothetical protein